MEFATIHGGSPMLGWKLQFFSKGRPWLTWLQILHDVLSCNRQNPRRFEHGTHRVEMPTWSFGWKEGPRSIRRYCWTEPGLLSLCVVTFMYQKRISFLTNKWGSQRIPQNRRTSSLWFTGDPQPGRCFIYGLARFEAALFTHCAHCSAAAPFTLSSSFRRTSF